MKRFYSYIVRLLHRSNNYKSCKDGNYLFIGYDPYKKATETWASCSLNRNIPEMIEAFIYDSSINGADHKLSDQEIADIYNRYIDGIRTAAEKRYADRDIFRKDAE